MAAREIQLWPEPPTRAPVVRPLLTLSRGPPVHLLGAWKLACELDFRGQPTPRTCCPSHRLAFHSKRSSVPTHAHSEQLEPEPAVRSHCTRSDAGGIRSPTDADAEAWTMKKAARPCAQGLRRTMELAGCADCIGIPSRHTPS
eukprot:6254881-Prymnesium_polylepis.2